MVTPSLFFVRGVLEQMSVSEQQRAPLYAVGKNPPSGAARSEADPMSPADLPSPDTRRWTIRRKAAVVAGVRKGFLTMEEACKRYSLSTDEFLSWQRLIDSHGLPGLRTTRTQEYRRSSNSD